LALKFYRDAVSGLNVLSRTCLFFLSRYSSRIETGNGGRDSARCVQIAEAPDLDCWRQVLKEL